MNYDHNKKFGLWKFHSGYGTFYFNSPKGYSQKIINAQTEYNFAENAKWHSILIDIYQEHTPS